MNARRLREILTPADPAIIEAGAGGERFVARVRVVFWAAVSVIPAATLLTMDAAPPEVWISFGASSFALLISAAFLLVVTRNRDTSILPFATAAFDVSLVSITLIAIALAGRPFVAVNSHVVWPIYVLTIVATAFRLDFRVCAFAGAATVVEYSLILAWITGRWGVAGSMSTEYGQFSWPTQVGKLLLLLVATALTIAIIQQTRRFAYVSGSDRLTGLGNRALFDEKVKIELSRAQRGNVPVSLAFVDIDHFKTFNDRWGHDTGDTALRQVAEVLRDELRATDSAFRWGGEEMILLLPGTDTAGAAHVLERVQAGLKGTQLPGLPADVRVTVSVGIAEFPTDAPTPDALVQRADARLLQAKRSGRDRIVTADSGAGIRLVS